MGGKGGGGRQQDGLDQQIYDQFYQAGKSGASYHWGGAADRETAAQMGYAAGQAARPVEIPDFSGMFHSMSESNSQQQADYEAEQQRQKEEAEAAEAERLRIEGENQRDALYGSYMDAASTATDYVNQEIIREQSNADLLGIEYNITDEQKATRINDYFATIWGESEQKQLEALMGEWGNPQGFGGFTVTRGDASVYEGRDEAKEESKGASTGLKPTLISEEDEDSLGGQTTILGV